MPRLGPLPRSGPDWSGSGRAGPGRAATPDLDGVTIQGGGILMFYSGGWILGSHVKSMSALKVKKDTYG